MLTFLGNLIEKRPWFVVSIIIIITLLFSSTLPSLEFKTDFQEFMPDDDLVKANTRVLENFGISQLPMFLLIEKQQSESVITPEVIREINLVEKELKNLPKVNGTIAITTLIEPVCIVEFGKTIENCSNEELCIAIEDILNEQQSGEILLFNEDDPNEKVDYKRKSLFSKSKSVDSADIKNCYIVKDEDTITFSIEVYDLSNFKQTLRPSFSKVNVMEWFIGFENLITPDKRLDINYRISAHIEPTHPLWEIGNGFVRNFINFIKLILNRELFNSYKKEVYLWISPPDQNNYFPIPLESGNITFNETSNRIIIDVSREEMGDYGIATRLGSFELPAKLSNFQAGVRYYQTSILKRPGGRVFINTSFLLNRLEKLSSRPILGTIASRILKKYGNMTWEDFDNLFEMMGETNLLPERLALQDIDSAWTTTDIVPDTGISDSIFFIYPYLYNDIQVASLALLSKDYYISQEPSSSLIILQLELMEDYNELLKTNEILLEEIKKLDEDFVSISIKVTGESVISAQIDELTTEANTVLGPSIFIVIIFILFFSFRRFSYVFLPMIALVVSTIWLLGTMTFLGIEFNVIAVALIPLILGLGVDYSVHLFHNYRIEIDKGNSPAKAIKLSIKEIGTAMFLAWLTTFIAFMSFLSSNIPPIRDFGILLALGVSYTFITAITLLAASRYILDRRKKININIRKNSFSVKNIMGKVASIVLRHQKKILIVMIIISIVFASGALQLKRGFDMNQFVPQDNPAIELFNEIAEEFPYASEYQEYILIEGDVATVKTLKGIAQTHKNIEDDTYISRNTDGSIKVSSIYSLMQSTIKNNESLLEKFNIDVKTSIPKTDKDLLAFYDYLYEGEYLDLPDLETSDFDVASIGSMEVKSVLYKNNSRYQATVVRIYIDASFQLSGNINEDLKILKNEINEDISDYGDANAIATGTSIMQYTITESLTDSQILSTGISLLLAAIVLIITYKNPVLGIIAIIPIGITIIWILGTMYYLGYILDVMTVTVTSITIGIGIDYAIHATERFRLVADKTGDVNKALRETISHTGGALLIAALTTSLGFGILILAPIPPQQRFGIIIAITIVYSFLISVLILPLFLARWAKWRKKRKGFIISESAAKYQN
jgi:predicted RND superfamily exporter protein